MIVFLIALTSRVFAEETVQIIGDDLEGPNVCKRIDHYNVTVVVTDTVPYQEVKSVWCAQPPFRCRKTEMKLRQVEKNEVHEKTRAIRECCEGYTENPARNKCIPKCDKPCVYGHCAAPNQCKCESGYGGPSCDISEFLQQLILTQIQFQLSLQQSAHRITTAKSAKRSVTASTEHSVTPTMENVTARRDIGEKSVRIFALPTRTARTVQRNVDVRTEENVITFRVNATVNRDSLAHCKSQMNISTIKFSLIIN